MNLFAVEVLRILHSYLSYKIDILGDYHVLGRIVRELYANCINMKIIVEGEGVVTDDGDFVGDGAIVEGVVGDVLVDRVVVEDRGVAGNEGEVVGCVEAFGDGIIEGKRKKKMTGYHKFMRLTAVS